LLRRRDSVIRREALGVLGSWHGQSFDAEGAAAVLDSATLIYPAIPGDVRQPDDLWVRLLWDQPQVANVVDVLRVYALAGERSRKALLHLLALRNDSEGIAGLVELLGNPSRSDQLPTPSAPLLEPIAGHPDALALLPAMVRLSTRSGWSREAAGILRQFELDGRLGSAERRQVVREIAPLICTLVDTCDRATCNDRDRVDVARVDRERLRVLTSLFAVLPGEEVSSTLYRVMSSADPQVAAHGAIALIARGEPVASERLELLTRDGVARVELFEGLTAEGVLSDVPDLFDDEVLLAEARLVRWLSAVAELGRHPDEIDYVGPYTVIADDGPGELHVFRFRMRAPHWSSSRGWLIGAVGEWAHSCYLAEDDCDLDAHIAALMDSVATWPESPER